MRSLVIVVSLLTASALVGCSTNPATGRTQLDLLSDAEVRAMGEEAKPQLVQEYGGEHPSGELRSYVDRVGRALLAGTEAHVAELNWEFILLDSDVINAFALPGGKVFMSRGLLERFDNEAELAGVLGHEIGHVTAQHVDERLSQTLAAQLGLSVLGSTTESELINLGAGVLVQGTMLKFNRNQESEADVLGVRYMTRAGYDPYGMLEVLHVLQEASRGAKQPEFLSTHPHPETRIKTVTSLLGGEYAYTQNNPSFKKYEDRFRREAVPFLNAPGVATVSPASFMHFCGTCAILANRDAAAR